MNTQTYSSDHFDYIPISSMSYTKILNMNNLTLDDPKDVYFAKVLKIIENLNLFYKKCFEQDLSLQGSISNQTKCNYIYDSSMIFAFMSNQFDLTSTEFNHENINQVIDLGINFHKEFLEKKIRCNYDPELPQ